jgi:hypothetical protein
MYRILGADGKEYGPTSADIVRRWIAEGRATGQTLSCVEGATGWRPLSAVPEFADLFAAPPLTRVPALVPMAAAPALRTSGMAVAGLICGLLGLTCCCCGPLCSLLGLVFSLIAISEINRNPQQFTGKGLAVAGIVLGVLGLAVNILPFIGGFGVEMFRGMHHAPRWRWT